MPNDLYAVIREPKESFAFAEIVWKPEGSPKTGASSEVFIPYACFTNTGGRFLSEEDVRDRYLRISGVEEPSQKGKFHRVTRAMLMPRISVAALSLRGHAKAINEDFCLHFAEAHRQYAFVADGVGGNPGGDLAAEYVCTRLFESLDHAYHDRRGTRRRSMPPHLDLAHDCPEVAAQSLLAHVLETDTALRTSSAGWIGKQNAMCVIAALAVVDFRVWVYRVGDTGIFGVAPNGTIVPLLPLPKDLNEKRISAAMGQGNVVLDVEVQEIADGSTIWRGFIVCTDGVYRDPAAFDALKECIDPKTDAVEWVKALEKKLVPLRRQDDSTVMAFSFMP